MHRGRWEQDLNQHSSLVSQGDPKGARAWRKGHHGHLGGWAVVDPREGALSQVHEMTQDWDKADVHRGPWAGSTGGDGYPGLGLQSCMSDSTHGSLMGGFPPHSLRAWCLRGEGWTVQQKQPVGNGPSVADSRTGLS